ncbi:MAG: thioredoxin [Verrucomicrobia bacterium]|nr:thioredoxin [Verrucomicrobiota bacterium]
MSSQRIVQISPDNFSKEVKQSPIPVLVDFWAEWCGPCRAIAPMLDEVAESHAGALKVAKVNVDANQNLAAEFGVRAIPTLLIFKGGEIKDQLLGAISRRDLENKLAPHLEPAKEPARKTTPAPVAAPAPAKPAAEAPLKPAAPTLEAIATELHELRESFERIQKDVQLLKEENTALKTDFARLKSDVPVKTAPAAKTARRKKSGAKSG